MEDGDQEARVTPEHPLAPGDLGIPRWVRRVGSFSWLLIGFLIAAGALAFIATATGGGDDGADRLAPGGRRDALARRLLLPSGAGRTGRGALRPRGRGGPCAHAIGAFRGAGAGR